VSQLLQGTQTAILPQHNERLARRRKRKRVVKADPASSETILPAADFLASLPVVSER